MKNKFSAFRDPQDGGDLTFFKDKLRNDRNGNTYPIIDDIPRFVCSTNYSDSFGVQWNKFRQTQLDSFTKTEITKTRLERCLNGHLGSIAGKNVLEAGSGAGRFTEILLAYGALVHSFDFSNAVNANYSNNGSNERLVLAQADIRNMPYVKHDYDYVVCLGVIQHTPSPEESIEFLYEMVKPGGVLIFDHYLFKIRNLLPPPIGSANILYRKAIMLLPLKLRFSVIKFVVDCFFPIHWFFRDSLLMQRILRRISPVHFYYPIIKLHSRQTYYDWALLDTHDSTTDYYKHHRSVDQIKRILSKLGAIDIIVSRAGNGVEAFCRKPYLTE